MKFEIELLDMTFDAKIGVHQEEKEAGNTFVIDLVLETLLPKACFSDDLEETIDYSLVYNLVSLEMQRPVDLLEKCSYAILSSIFERFLSISNIKIAFRKKAPLYMPNCGFSGVKVSMSRGEYEEIRDSIQ